MLELALIHYASSVRLAFWDSGVDAFAYMERAFGHEDTQRWLWICFCASEFT